MTLKIYFGLVSLIKKPKYSILILRFQFIIFTTEDLKVKSILSSEVNEGKEVLLTRKLFWNRSLKNNFLILLEFVRDVTN